MATAMTTMTIISNTWSTRHAGNAIFIEREWSKKLVIWLKSVYICCCKIKAGVLLIFEHCILEYTGHSVLLLNACQPTSAGQGTQRVGSGVKR